MKRATTIACLFILLLTPVFAWGQTAKELGLVLALDGKVQRCSTAAAENPKVECRKFRMVFRNEGKDPVIILNPNLGYGTGLKEIVYHFDYNSYEVRKGFVHHVEDVATQVSPDANKVENFKEISKFFGGDRPSENMTVILQPNDSYAFEESFEVEKVYQSSVWEDIRTRKDKVTGKDTYSIETSTQRENPISFKLVYEFSFLPYIADPDLLEKLSLRWKKYGRLPVGTNGTYTITSEPIK